MQHSDIVKLAFLRAAGDKRSAQSHHGILTLTNGSRSAPLGIGHAASVSTTNKGVAEVASVVDFVAIRE